MLAFLGNENKVVKRILKKTILARMKKRHSISTEGQSRLIKAEERPTHDFEDHSGQLNHDYSIGQMNRASCEQIEHGRNGQHHQYQQNFSSQGHFDQYASQGHHEGQYVQNYSGGADDQQSHCQQQGHKRPEYDLLNPHSDLFQGMSVDELPEITYCETILDFDDNFLICV